MLPCGDPGKRVPALFVVAERTDEKKAYELLDGNVISAGASISAAKSPVPMETSGIHDMSL